MDTFNTANQDKENLVNTSSNELKKSILENTSFIFLLATLFLSPLVFINTSSFSVDSVKAEIIIFGVLISLLSYILYFLQKRSISVSKNPLAVISVLISVSMLVSAFMSTSVQKSLIGQGVELGTASFLILMFIVTFFVSRIASKSKDRLLTVYGSIIFSFLVLAVFHILRLIISTSFLSFGSLNSVTSTLIGRWSDLGIFAGLVFLISFFAVSLFTAKKSIKILTIVVLIVSAFIVFIVNSPFVWTTIALVLLGYGIYNYVTTPGTDSGMKKFVSRISLLTLIFFVISVAMVWKGTSFQTSVLKSFYQEQTEIPLPWQLTLDVTSDTIKENPLFGAGPNRFGNEFLLHKPLMLNPSAFWNVEFATGFGFLPSIIVTQGLIGTVLWIIFFVFFFVLGIRGLMNAKESFAKFSIVSTFFSSVFMWVMLALFSPSHVIMLLTFVMTGLFIATLISEGILQTKEYRNSDGTNIGKMLTPLMVLLMIVLITWTLFYVKKIVALSYFQSGISILTASNNKEIEKAEVSFNKAISWDKSDVYYQVISGVDVLKTTPIIQQLQEQAKKDPKTIDQELVKTLTALITRAASSSISAINIDPTNYYNYVASAKVFELANSLKYEGAYENAKNAYTSALRFNPYSPLLYLNIAQLDASNNKLDLAQQSIGSALQLKQNYTEAIFLLSQIQVSQNKIKDAIISAQVMTQINPKNSLLFFQLGFLHYNDKNFEGAIEALKKAVEFNDQYANARYFLGLSYARLSKNTEAIEQFTKIQETNPENQEVVSIIATLKAGKSPFTEVKNTVETKPAEKRGTLPVKEKAATTPASKSKVAN